ncbi:MAG TPA: hypothetical protein PKN33_16945 [Phycisphaerae bacterium]|nr:hypothetical protein [Phycisphaerae bacterium]
MTANVYRFGFVPAVPLSEAELTLHLAIYATEGLHGEARVRLDVSYKLDVLANAILVDGRTDVGASLVKVFTQLLIRQFGEDGFHVRRVVASAIGTPNPEQPAKREETATAAA